MKTSLRFLGLTTLCLVLAATAGAQTSSTTGSDETTRPATTTFDGDTGLWYVPTAETLARGAFSASVLFRSRAMVSAIKCQWPGGIEV